MTRPLILDNPSLQTTLQRVSNYTLTVAFWIFWIYVWVPVLSLLAWGLELGFIYEHMIILEGFSAFSQVMKYYLGVIAIMGIVLLGWAKINERRFKNIERRSGLPPVSTEELAITYAVSKKALEKWQLTKSMRVFHDEHGMPIAVDCKYDDVNRVDAAGPVGLSGALNKRQKPDERGAASHHSARRVMPETPSTSETRSQEQQPAPGHPGGDATG